jgi:thiol-disulfide isomerase/thioredoxin
MWLLLLFSAAGVLFWYNEWQYQLPTPVPPNYKPVNTGKVVALDTAFASFTGKPIFLHFFNPDCPCSRFNMSHFKDLVRKYGNRIDFVIVVISRKPFTAQDIQDKFDIRLRVLFDASVAASCGVYSTPQAVILDGQHRLYYRGNYNSSRYCSDEKTSYAKIALACFLHERTRTDFSPLALKAYGCRLPGCRN